MVSAITLGSLYTTSTGALALNSAGGSGLDEQTLLTALTQSLQNQVTPIKDQVTLNTNKISALTQFNTLMTSLKTAATALSNPAGFNQASNSAFAFVKAGVTASDGSAGSNYISVTAQPGATQQTFTLGNDTDAAIIQLAQAKQQISNTFSIASADASVVDAAPGGGSHRFKAGTFQVNGVNITLNTDDSLNTVANDFNAVSSQTGIAATVVQIASGTYDLQFTATQTGEAHDFSLNAGDPETVVVDASGVLSTGGVTFTQTQDAQDSKFTLNGQVIQRSTNSITDAIQGITFNLLQPTPTDPANTTLNVAITPDTTTAENGIVNFMNAYNAMMTFYAQQTQLNSDGTYSSTSYLAQDNTLNSTVSNMQSEVARVVNGLSGTLTSLGALGITFTTIPPQTDATGKQTQPAVSNVLTYDQSKLEAALTSNFSSVQAIFGFTFTATNANLAVVSRTNALNTNNFTLDIEPSTSKFQATYTDSAGSHTVNLTATLLSSGRGYTLAGPDGTALAGLNLLYASTADAPSVSVTATQGIGDRVTNMAASLIAANTGGIANDISALQTNSTSLNSNIDQLNKQIATQTQQYQNQFSLLEQAISRANTLLSTLTAQSNAQLAATAFGG